MLLFTHYLPFISHNVWQVSVLGQGPLSSNQAWTTRQCTLAQRVHTCTAATPLPLPLALATHIHMCVHTRASFMHTHTHTHTRTHTRAHTHTYTHTPPPPPPRCAISRVRTMPRMSLVAMNMQILLCIPRYYFAFNETQASYMHSPQCTTFYYYMAVL